MTEEQTKQTEETKEIKEPFYEKLPNLKTPDFIFPAHIKEVIEMVFEMYENAKEEYAKYLKTPTDMLEKFILHVITTFLTMIKMVDNIGFQFLNYFCNCAIWGLLESVYNMFFKKYVDQIKKAIDDEVENKNEDEGMCPKLVEFATSSFKLIDMLLPEPEKEEGEENDEEGEEEEGETLLNVSKNDNEETIDNKFFVTFWFVVRYVALFKTFYLLRKLAGHAKNKKKGSEKCKCFCNFCHDIIKHYYNFLVAIFHLKFTDAASEVSEGVQKVFKNLGTCKTVLLKKNEKETTEEKEEQQQEEKKEK
ncbi:hypothetical protein M0812_18837 [Anaeramoeba flamelloides]|uniref:Uncharacterized protein n=1 Tax=Anaeramoeba flamelloides TaxID=1746091 RepID=A0AAV7Z854_9EUKA|nr:hypothetical protein M0812_18837 [Anaeramoeba flamelloides]